MVTRYGEVMHEFQLNGQTVLKRFSRSILRFPLSSISDIDLIDSSIMRAGLTVSQQIL